MRSALDQVARILTRNQEADTFQIPWNLLRYDHMAALRSRLAELYAPATANKMLAAVRGVLRSAWQLETIDTDAYTRAIAVKGRARHPPARRPGAAGR